LYGKKELISIFLGCAFFLCVSIPVYAVPYSFYSISNNLVGDVVIGEAQLFVDATDYGSGKVLFTFSNTEPAASSITDVYFDDGTLLGIAGLIDADDGIGGDSGVDFSQGASPGNLPAGNTAAPPFVATAGFLADSDPPTQSNGVNPGEFLGIIFDLQSGGVFADVIKELGYGALRIGIHVQGFGSGGSESFINNPSAVPEPATMFLLGSGLVGFAGFRRKRFKK
jgi:hypothetical protein